MAGCPSSLCARVRSFLENLVKRLSAELSRLQPPASQPPSYPLMEVRGRTASAHAGGRMGVGCLMCTCPSARPCTFVLHTPTPPRISSAESMFVCVCVCA